MNDRRIELKVKIKSLAEEAKIIKREEKKALSKNDRDKYVSLYLHRIQIVRPECRSSNLAYGFLRGRPYSKLERKCYEAPDFRYVKKLVDKFGQQDIPDLETPWPERKIKQDRDWKEWLDTALKHLENPDSNRDETSSNPPGTDLNTGLV